MTARHEMPTPGPALEIAQTFAALIPRIETDRLVLRAPCLSDFEGYAEIACGLRGQYIDGPFSREDAWDGFISLSSGWMLHGHGGWTIEDKVTEAVAGFICLGLEPGDQEVELGFLLRDWAEGQSIAFEAACAARRFAWDTLRLPTLVSYIDKRNTRSLALAARLGGFDDTPAGFEPGTRVFRHTNPEATQ